MLCILKANETKIKKDQEKKPTRERETLNDQANISRQN